ncbi:MAG: hypothetical protein KDC98_01840 [Planctomycetes bacterium]|nr:hypothetical protein [Planctomycetota bacterium]
MTNTRCQSCTMPIESGTWCQHCSDEHGALRQFDDMFERMVQWRSRQQPDLERDAAERETLEFMAAQPAWRDHTEVKRRLRG